MLVASVGVPAGVALDGSGNVFVADAGNNAVKEILAAGGYVTANTLDSGFQSPTGVAVDSNGNVLSPKRITVKEILAAGGYVTVNTLGSGFNSPVGVTVDGSANVFVVITLGGGFNTPVGVAVDGSGNVFFADQQNAVKEILGAAQPLPLRRCPPWTGVACWR